MSTTAESKADLILHPIRMRIIQAFIAGQKRTTQQLVKQLADVPQATMYRHLNKLLKAGILEVAEENKIRGTYEKVYFLAQGGGDVSPEDLTEKSATHHMELFLKFTASLIGDFSAYVRQEHYHMLKDGISFRQLHAYLSDDEYSHLLQEIREPLQRAANNEPAEGRRRRIISTIVIPEAISNSNSQKKEDDENGHAG
ncbi:helix-turn-helix domain-containing protein [Paenibacillus sp. Soil522]|uniref:helix-turn-helix domain-containing protein n=1 Tax=Paenibacillus sp. Soil522 TaxID=1736388 RepID=UPI001F42B366|nr:helix-turn-helix domain-containing protein [Paenibacillus sp. Soil522]